jgi:hypothetical protein
MTIIISENRIWIKVKIIKNKNTFQTNKIVYIEKEYQMSIKNKVKIKYIIGW